MNSIAVSTLVATTTDSCDRLVVYTPQRKARYSDKARVRLADIKRIGLRDCKCRDAKEMKQRLRHLGIKLDLRLTSAWMAITWELQPVIEKLTAAASCQTVVIEQPPLPAKKILPPITHREPPVFSSDEEAMTYYLNIYSPC